MNETFELNASKIPAQLSKSGITIVAPGLRGQGTWRGLRKGGEVRSATAETEGLDQALIDAGLEDRHTLELEPRTPEVPSGWIPKTLDELAADEILIQVPSQVGEAQFVIYKDEDGVVGFHLPEKVDPGQALPTRAPAPLLYRYRFRLRRPIGRAEGPSERRGVFGSLAKKIIKVIVFRALEAPSGAFIYRSVAAWENRRRAYQGFHGGGDSDHLLDSTPTPFENWADLSGRRALLFIHGTTSTTCGAFEGLKLFPQVARRLYQAYDQRVLGFNHHTLSVGVATNVIQFYQAFGRHEGDYEFDIICHSRGGLLARALGELSQDDIQNLAGQTFVRPAGVTVKVGRVVFVATPNAGTDLADPDNLPKWLDRIANLINFLPDSMGSFSLAAVFSVAGFVSETGLRHLPGLADQSPRSTFLSRLNVPPGDPARYYALQANYEPCGGLIDAVRGATVDKVFHQQKNDLVVPTTGVSTTPEFSLDPTHVMEFDSGKGVHHNSFFSQPLTWERIMNSLGVS